MQAKGSFKCLIKGKQPPDITEGASWKELPRIKYRDLASVPIQLPEKLLPDQIALQDGLVIGIKDLFDGNLDEETKEKITNNEDSMLSIVQVEMSSKYASNSPMTDWFEKEQKHVPDGLQAILGKDPIAMAILTRLLKGIEEGKIDAQLRIDRTLLAQDSRSQLESFHRHFQET